MHQLAEMLNLRLVLDRSEVETATRTDGDAYSRLTGATSTASRLVCLLLLSKLCMTINTR